MNVSRRGCLLFVATAIIFASGALAQPFPNRTIRLVVADAPGGAPDQLARLLAQKLSDGVGQPVIVDNRAGAGGVVGAEMVAKSPPDGYTLLLTTTAIYAILPNLRKDLPYDASASFVPISRIAPLMSMRSMGSIWKATLRAMARLYHTGNALAI